MGDFSKSWTPVWLPGTACTAFALIVFLAGHNLDVFSDLQELVKELSIAFLIAGILSFTIELVNRFRHETVMREIMTQVHRAVYRRSLPDVILKECERSILRSQLYRDEDRHWYTLLSTEKGNLRLIGRTIFFLVNSTDEEISHELTFALIDNPGVEEDATIDEVRISDKVLSDKELRKALRRNGPNVSFSKHLSCGPRSRTKIYIQYSQIHLGKQSFETICGILPSTGLSVEVYVPFADLVVDFSTLHPLPHDRLDRDDGNRVFAAMLPAAALPGQGMLFYWRPRNLAAKPVDN